jgi:hypothetical protein
MGGVCAVVLKAAAEVEEEVGICRALPLYSRGVSVAGVPFGAVPGVRANGRNGMACPHARPSQCWSKPASPTPQY